MNKDLHRLTTLVGIQVSGAILQEGDCIILIKVKGSLIQEGVFNLETKFRHIARAVIVYQNQILIAKMKGAHSFLPGGGVELGEGAKSALKRELQEELGITTCQVGRFLGVIEQCYDEVPDKYRMHEITHLFEVNVNSLDSKVSPSSSESHLEFYWAELTKESLTACNVLPEILQETLPSIIFEKKTQWMSTM